MAENEVEIIITAVDNASKDIKQVSQSITGVSKAADAAPISTAKLNAAMQLVGRVSPQAENAVRGVSASIKLLSGTALSAGTLIAGAFTAVAAGFAASAIIAKKAADNWSTDVLATWVEHTAEQKAVAEEYKHNLDEITGSYENLKNAAKDWWGDTSTRAWNVIFSKIGTPNIPVKLEPKITQEDFDNLVAQGVKAAQEAAEAASATAQKFQNDWFKSLFTNAMNFQSMMDKADELKKTYDEIRNAGPKYGDMSGYLEATGKAKKDWEDSLDAITQQKNQLIAMKLIEYFGSAGSPGGIEYTPLETTAITQFLQNTGLAANNAIIAAWNVNSETAAIINGVIEETKSNIGSLDSKIKNIQDKVIQITIKATATGDTFVLDWLASNTSSTGTSQGQNGGDWGGMAGGGDFKGWGMVGDAPGGGITPYTEWVYAPYGARVYNQSQIGNLQAPPMASGGFIDPAKLSIDYDKLAIIVRDAVLLAL